MFGVMIRLTVDDYVYGVGADTRAGHHFYTVIVEVFELRHREVLIVQSGLIQQFDGRDGSAVDVLRKLLCHITEDIETSVRVGGVAWEENWSDQSTVVLAVLRSRCSMKIDHDLKAELA